MTKNSTSKIGADKSEVVAQIPAACADEAKAVEFMERQRWGDSPACPRCGDLNVRQMLDNRGNRSARFLWRCGGCKGQFTVRIGTILEDSRVPLRHWCYAFWAACSSKKGVSALQIKRQTGLSYKSALFLMHRIRFAMATDHAPMPQLAGTVEVDETYVGGKPRFKGQRKPGRGTDKAPVVALVERGGQVRAFHAARVDAATLKGAIREMVDPSSRIVTDECRLYQRIGREFWGGHHTVNHTRKEYSRGDVHTNTVEGFFALLKRGIYGTFHSVSKRHLHRYVAEFEFRYNNRKLDDGARTVAAIRGGEGKRLTYRPVTSRPAHVA